MIVGEEEEVVFFIASRNAPNGVMKGLASSILGMFQGEREGLEDVEERSEEGEVGKMEMKSRLCSG